jgi:predicted HTH transcriptional regulator
MKMILEGEHQKQDFKYCISDSRKIAKSLVAFANTDGGRLLIGVKDNGNIVGVRSDEEYYMIESAAKIFSKPEIEFSSRQHVADNKIVLEIIVASSPAKPHFAKDDDEQWWAYYRHHDENKLANKVMIEVWRKQKRPKGIFINYSKDEKFLLDYLSKNPDITHSAYSRKAGITYKRAEHILSDFIVLGILKFVFGEKQIRYALADDFDRKSWEQFGSA